MKIVALSFEFKHDCLTNLYTFSSEDKADAFAARVAREIAEAREEDFESGEWLDYLQELEECCVLRFERQITVLDETD